MVHAATAYVGGYSVVLRGNLAATATGWRWPAVVFAVLDGGTAVVLSVWLAAWLQSRWNAPAGPVTGTAVRASYPAYILHPSVLVGLSASARTTLPWPPEATFVIVAALGIPASFAVGHLLTRLPAVNRVL